MPKTTVTTPQPPAAVVAADAHWSATLQRLHNRQPAQSTLRLWEDSALKEAFNEVERRAARTALLAEAHPDDDAKRAAADAAAADLADAVQAADRVSVTLRFRALPGPAFEDLVEEHPPTPAQAEKDPGIEWNPKTFPAALIAAASVDGITPEQAAEFMATWGTADRADLFRGALGPQTERRGDLGKG
ncbi:hypothetical protein OG618_37150 (plasmid) [Kitasatospora sp. NBC_01246]|uniref:hypothetical protein n=1 Tax=Kitasatospora sp. NBC_01246 TaxID=2903570 RepID=UPI002E369B52|nr:hypothetical protein [Kitasatospora sp. NBC_01246]